ncbi:MAG: type I DNA topoisomerase [Eubacteriaceae bacterium]|nr:type I DNA topoisomerase [Eubacteriaceae bacterium]
MPVTLVIVESPAKAKTIEKYLPSGCKVAATMGHVIDLPASKLGIDIEEGYKPDYKPIKGKATVLKALKSESKKADEVILATDPDREGEAISYHLANYLGLSLEDHNRIEFHEITPAAISEAMNAKRKVNQNLVDAQQARRILDRLVGYQISPVLWRKVMRGLSAGRVQSVAIRMIVDRENEIRAFIPEEYWNLSSILKSQSSPTPFEARLTKISGKKAEIKNKEEAAEIVAALNTQQYTVGNVRISTRRRKPAAPFITSTLQQDAYQKLHFTTRRTMALAQQLYEGIDVPGQGTIGLITYMRTDSTRVAEVAQEVAKAIITRDFGKEYVGKGVEGKKRQASQDAHEAIRPTDLELSPEKLEKVLSKDLLKVYTLIYKRFMASRMSDAVYDTIGADISCGKLTLRASGSKLKFAGFLKMYDADETAEADSELPLLEKGESLELVKVNAEQKFTQPPPRYTEGSLVKALEEGAIGRPSTYSPIISTIMNRNYVIQEDKKFMPTDLGEAVVKLMVENFESIVDLGFTSIMERQLDKIADGEENWVEVVDGFYHGLKEDLDKADAIERVKLPVRETGEICEKCGKNMVIKYGRFGQFLACPGFPECTNAKALTVKIDAKCPLCGGDVVQRKSKKGRSFFGCKNYPDCNFVSWQQPTNNKCPKCGQILYVKGKDKGLYCQNKECGYTEEEAS